jgi:hypothetical protein
MTEAEWRESDVSSELIDVIHARPAERKKRYVLIAICRQLRGLLQDPRTLAAVEASERHAEGLIVAAELETIRDTAAPADDRGLTASWERWVGGKRKTRYARALAAKAAWSASGGDLHGALGFAWAVESGQVTQFHQDYSRLLRDIFGNPFRPVDFSPQWRTDTAVALARQMYDSRDFGAMPILADALEDAGCEEGQLLGHCRGVGPHVRGCWVVDLLLAKE